MQPSIVQGILRGRRDVRTLAKDSDDGNGDETDRAEAADAAGAEGTLAETAVPAGASTEDEEGGWDCNRWSRHPCLYAER